MILIFGPKNYVYIVKEKMIIFNINILNYFDYICIFLFILKDKK